MAVAELEQETGMKRVATSPTIPELKTRVVFLEVSSEPVSQLHPDCTSAPRTEWSKNILRASGITPEIDQSCPVTGNNAPVIDFASSDAKNRITAANAVGVTHLA